MTDPLLFALAVLAILATPGPTNTLLATGAASAGFRRALPLIPAEAAGYLIAISAIGYGLGPVVAASPLLGLALRLAVGAYLIYLAYKLWRGGRQPALVAGIVTPVRVFLTTLLNPKAIVFALGILPLQAEQGWAYLLSFACLVAGVALGWIGFGVLLGRAVETTACEGLVPRVGAAVVGTFAVVLMSAPLMH
jgi:threonine/homoserine/homoserine lactone efflux protein